MTIYVSELFGGVTQIQTPPHNRARIHFQVRKETVRLFSVGDKLREWSASQTRVKVRHRIRHAALIYALLVD